MSHHSSSKLKLSIINGFPRKGHLDASRALQIFKILPFLPRAPANSHEHKPTRALGRTQLQRVTQDSCRRVLALPRPDKGIYARRILYASARAPLSLSLSRYIRSRTLGGRSKRRRITVRANVRGCAREDV